jgi:hypothetical protein
MKPIPMAMAIWAVVAGLAAVPASAAGDCTQRSELECVISTDCILERTGDLNAVYVCREPANACETDFVQMWDFNAAPEERHDTQAMCAAKAGCRFAPGKCYCPPFEFIECYCGGGTPSLCVPD